MCRRTRKSLDFRIREQHKNFWLEQSFQDRYGGREVGGEVGGWLMKYLILPACVGAGTLLLRTTMQNFRQEGTSLKDPSLGAEPGE